MSCIPSQYPEQSLRPVCRIPYAVLLLGVLIAFLSSFKLQVGGSAYQIHWTLFVFGLIPYVIYGAFLGMANSTWLAVGGIVLVVADIAGRLLAPDMDILAGWQPLWLAALVIVTVGVGILGARQRTTIHPEEPTELEGEPNGPS